MAMNPRITNWQGQRVWLVGASTGIGRAVAQRLHAAGARVAVSARNADALGAFEREHPGSLALPLDATDRVATQAAAASIVRVAPVPEPGSALCVGLSALLLLRRRRISVTA